MIICVFRRNLDWEFPDLAEFDCMAPDFTSGIALKMQVLKDKGPLGLDDILAKHGENDIELYQIYGAHDVHGSDVLLYLGKTVKQNFAARFEKHQNDWIKWEPSEVDIYLGRLVSSADENDIDISEKLLLFYATPPYNSSGIVKHGIEDKVIVLNLGRKNRLP